MSREESKAGKPKGDPGAETGEKVSGDAIDPEENAKLEAYTGPDGSKSLGYLKQPPVADSSGLGADADDAGRTQQAPGQNTGGSPGPALTSEGQPSGALNVGATGPAKPADKSEKKEKKG